MPYKIRSVQLESQREHYQRNKKVYSERGKMNRKRNREFVQNLKSESGCVRCGYNKSPYALDFDHIEGSEKKFGISKGVRMAYSIKRLTSEIEKCQVLCANCHRTKGKIW